MANMTREAEAILGYAKDLADAANAFDAAAGGADDAALEEAAGDIDIYTNAIKEAADSMIGILDSSMD